MMLTRAHLKMGLTEYSAEKGNALSMLNVPKPKEHRKILNMVFKCSYKAVLALENIKRGWINC